MVDNIKQFVAGEKRVKDPESEMIAAAKRDPSAFGALYDRYVQPVFRYLYSRTGVLQAAEDLTSQTFIAALEGIARYRHDGHFSAWLFTIARRKAADYFRQQKVDVPLDETHQGVVDSDLLQNTIKTEKAAALAKLISVLSEDERELISLRYVAELKFREIASILGRNEDAVKKTLYRLLARLKSQLEEIND